MNTCDGNVQQLVTHPLPAVLAESAEKCSATCWLVGGAVRDIYRGMPVNDFDLAIKGPVGELSRIFAKAVGGTFFWLDEGRGHARVVVKRDSLVFDLAPVKGATIEEDLQQRDFTINAMAIPLKGEPRLLDPLKGCDDLAAATIRGCGPHAFTDDPLRLLRAVRFAAAMHFRIESGTWEHVVDHAHLITRVAGERVRDEFFRILSVDGAGHYLFLLDEAGLLTKILPSYCRGEGSIEKVSQVEKVVTHLKALFPDHHEPLIAHLRHETEAGVTRQTLLKLAMLLVSTDCADRVAAYHHLSTLSRRILARIVSARGTFPAPAAWTGRPLYRYFRDREPAGLETLLAELAADQHDQARRDLCRNLVTYYFRDYNPRDQDLLLTGAEVMEILALPAGPTVGAAMEALRAAEARGEVENADEAADFLRKNKLTATAGVV